MSSAKFPLPGAFDFSAPEAWPTWKARFERFRSLTKLDESDQPRQVDTLVYSMGPEADPIFESLNLSAEDKKKIAPVLSAFDKYFRPGVNVIHQRTLFEHCVQSPGETVETYVRRLRAAAKYCAFDKPDERIRDRLVAHMTNREVSKKLQLEDHTSLDLETAVSLARKTESVNAEVAQQSSLDGHLGKQAAAAITSRARGHGQRSSPASSKSSSKKSYQSSSGNFRKCLWCGSSKDHKANRDECPAKSKTCLTCQKTGHFASVCRSSSNGSGRAAHAASTTGHDEDPAHFLGAASTQSNSADAPWTVQLRVCHADVNFKIDTGADLNILTRDCFHTLPERPALSPTKSHVTGADGKKLDIDGEFSTEATLHGVSYSITLLVIATGGVNLLSRQTSQRMGLVQRGHIGVSTASPALGCMLGDPVKIELRPDAKPYNCVNARRVPIHIRLKVRRELERMETEGVITKVEQPTDWCAPMVPVLKPNGNVRVCVDLKKLNASVKREHFPLPTVDDTLAKLNGSTIFSTLDTASGFWQIPLSEEASMFTTFITPFGRFKFERLPFGITSAPEIFQRRLQQLLGDIPNVAVFIDDIIVYAATMSEHDAALEAVKQRLIDAGLTLNPDKCRFRRTSLKYLGHQISDKGVNPDPAKLEAIEKLTVPSDVDELRRALGLITYLSKFLPELSTVAAPLRDLLCNDTAWQWTAAHTEAFNRLKQLAADAPCLCYYDLEAPTLLTADASSYGLGAALLQFQNGEWKPVAYASRTLSAAEKRYAQIEKELLATVWGCEHFHQYLYGGPRFTVHTDHKPLVPLINSRDLDRVPLRCQRLLIRLMRYDAQAEYVPGKNMVVADTLSRAPLPTAPVKESELHGDSEATIAAVLASLCSPEKEHELVEATANDVTLQKVQHYTLHGWPARVPADLEPYRNERASLSTHGGLLYHGFRIVIPVAERASTLAKLHDGHQGITKCQARAKSSAWWPGISMAVAEYVRNCTICSKHRYQPPEPLQPTEFPSLPWERVGVDLCHYNGHDYLVVVDYFSRYIHASPVRSTTSQSIIKELLKLFAIHGVPEVLVSDNGPQFASAEFSAFATVMKVSHRTSSPRYPQSNGEAERAVQTVKRLLKTNDNLDDALLVYRSTPLANGFSPAELLFGRRLRTRLPSTKEALRPGWPDIEALRKREAASKTRQSASYDAAHRVQPLPVLEQGTRVWIPDLESEAVVTERTDERSYTVATDDLTEYRRNRRHIKILPDVQPAPQLNASAPEPPSADVEFQPALRRSTRPSRPPPRLDL
ncbi:uncharacterized protein K02A2.6-like [Sycon ciliatum]|uniref:uncharacterized protein K02A2.6-like n=1 Tax=Sycon ciliatum TaxID=27933 RepID=UPI0031F64886